MEEEESSHSEVKTKSWNVEKQAARGPVKIVLPAHVRWIRIQSYKLLNHQLAFSLALWD
jgi:hypothetical protein